MNERTSDWAGPDDSKRPLVEEIMALLGEVGDKLEPHSQQMRQWMRENNHNPEMADAIQDATLPMLRVLDAIGRLGPVNGITISRQADVTKGSVSKITRRLLAKRLIVKESLPNNKKEVLFRVTPLGQELFLAHRAFDQEMETGFVKFLREYDAEKLMFIVQVLEDFKNATFIGFSPVEEGNGEAEED